MKRLVSIEDLGGADGVLTDKTGTLTEGNIVLLETIGPDGKAADGLAELGLACSQLDVSSLPWLRSETTSSCSSAEPVVTAAPSPVVICLFG